MLPVTRKFEPDLDWVFLPQIIQSRKYLTGVPNFAYFSWFPMYPSWQSNSLITQSVEEQVRRASSETQASGFSCPSFKSRVKTCKTSYSKLYTQHMPLVICSEKDLLACDIQVTTVYPSPLGPKNVLLKPSLSSSCPPDYINILHTCCMCCWFTSLKANCEKLENLKPLMQHPKDEFMFKFKELFVILRKM